MEVRGEEPGDQDAIRAVHDRAFGGPAEGVLVDRLRRSAAWLPHLSLVADDAGTVIGHVLFSRIRVGEGSGAVDALALAPMAVVPGRQRQGVGWALIDAGLSVARWAEEDLVVVLGDPEYYGRFGFRPASLQAVTSPWPEAGDALQTLALSPAGQEARGPARYPQPFDAF